MIEFETALIASLLLLTDIICSGIAAWRANPKLSLISGAATSAGVTLVVGSMVMPITAAAISAVAIAFYLAWLKNLSHKRQHRLIT